MRIQSSNVSSQPNKDYRIKVGQTPHQNALNRSVSRQKSETDFERIPKSKLVLKQTQKTENTQINAVRSIGRDDPSSPKTQKHKENKFKIVKLQNNFVPQKIGATLQDVCENNQAQIQKAKKLLYVHNNEIKTEFNSLVQENKHLETKIKQLRKEREQLEKELTGGKIGPFNHSTNKKSIMKVEAQKILKDNLKSKKEMNESLKNEFKHLKNILKDENLTNLKNENIALVNSLVKMREIIVRENTELENLRLKGNNQSKEPHMSANNLAECRLKLQKKQKRHAKLQVL